MSVEDELTIAELAEQAGMTVRTLRDYHERGLLPPAKMKGRTGFYSAEHLDRVRIVTRLLDRGITLNGVRSLLEAWDRGEDLADILGVSAATTPPPPQALSATATVPAAELAERFRGVPDGLAAAVAAGLYEPVDENTYRPGDPALIELFDQLVADGLPIDRALDEIEMLRTDCDHIARQFTDLFVRTALRSYRRSARSERDIDRLAGELAVARARPSAVATGLIDRMVDSYLRSAVSRDLPGVLPDR
ncbi:MerR family transcriptional regulator [Nocardia sp. alder85J]|uniref:MerR family transcriptional regulator n=1 Tax=Nocardia sp. alder85J TaxID=2862949 RepID=UPI001CD6629C|nr:MerR family transcriptional regulator [Nocardia sp. alder85J]MCX4091097.1 MerR family transcriptional regulator [Nocardia sp. alder85J]